MFSSSMHTARLLPVSPSMYCSGGWGRGCRVYLIPGACTWSQWGVPGSRGVPGPEGYLPGGCSWSGGVPGPRGFTWSCGGVPGPRGWYLSWGVYLVPGECTWSQGGTCPGTPPMNRMTDTCKNITFANFFCGRQLYIFLLKGERLKRRG